MVGMFFKDELVNIAPNITYTCMHIVPNSDLLYPKIIETTNYWIYILFLTGSLSLFPLTTCLNIV